ncbi:Hypothetical protein P9303_19581 [Prochlorococcus marinus str. MIT 9303]|uniref:Uncharacterized protein n=1 Tax=Prochlorococcus marinus (strain MIT 9303) TaxID=59922 RepID=A2CB40_PROM3|nr:Hypothetical protein P9303_19581 [Prochlorococcus marinus str. MIT 9303]
MARLELISVEILSPWRPAARGFAVVWPELTEVFWLMTDDRHSSDDCNGPLISNGQNPFQCLEFYANRCAAGGPAN